jgi:hypothetical protein
MNDTDPAKTSFEDQAAGPQAGLAGEFWSFLRHNKKWWLAPMLVVLLGLGLMVMLSGTAVAPFIYTLF